VKFLHIKHNLFAGNETLSLSAYDLIAVSAWGTVPPIWGRGLVRGSSVVRRESSPYWAHFACCNRNSISHCLQFNHHAFCGGPSPSWGRGAARARVWYPVNVLHIGHIIACRNRNSISHRLQANRHMAQFICWNRNSVSSVYEPIEIHILLGERPQIWGRGGVRGSSVVPWYPVKAFHMGILC